jgi:RND family efflux transporter MFP subunit
MKLRRNIFRGAVGLTTLLVLTACKVESPAPAAAPTVLVSTPIQREVTGWDSFSGRFEATDTVEVRARVGGYVEQVAFRDGALVKKGDLLFVIDPRPYQAAVEQAEGRLAEARSQLQLAGIEMGRADRLIATGALATTVRDHRVQGQQAAQAGVTTASAALARARLDLEFTRVRSPMSGRISRKLVSEGNLIAGGDASATLLTTVVSVDPINVYFDIDEESYLRYGRLASEGKRKSVGNLGSEVKIALPGESTAQLSGTLEFVENRLDRSTGTLRARARVANADQSLNPGQFARVQLIGDAAHQALLIDDAAITTDASRRVVNVVGEDDRVAARQVQLGKLFGNLREISAGLKATDRVIVGGLQRAQPGDKVTAKVQPVAEKTAAKEEAK